MTDIVERLRLRRDPLTDGERAEAADEIERLREARHQALEAGDAARREVNRLRAHIAEIEAWRDRGDAILVEQRGNLGGMFVVGKWWGERPWR
jgi:hypothetical protein